MKLRLSSLTGRAPSAGSSLTKHKAPILALLAAGFFCQAAVAQAATLVAWDFTGNFGAEQEVVSTTTDFGLVEESILTPGPGAPVVNEVIDGYYSYGFGKSGISTANLDYFTFTVTALPGQTLALSSLYTRWGGSDLFSYDGGQIGWAYRTSSQSEFTLFPVFQTLDASTGDWTLDLSGYSDLQSVSSVEFRYYASGGSLSDLFPMSWGFTPYQALDQNGQPNSLTLQGTAAVPEPSTWALFTIAGLGLIIVLRKRKVPLSAQVGH